jgi:3',5'-cyclic AMP phosphodiesterase CpdA
VRILHVSDLHMPPAVHALPPADWLSKRPVAILNMLIRRGRQFRRVPEKLRALAEFVRDEGVDLVVCTGDLTFVGTRGELRAARRAMEPLIAAPPLGFVGMPGNHDVYAGNSKRERRFEREFGDTLRSDLPEHAVDGPWPLVRLVGRDVAVAAVNSTRPHAVPWRSDGRIPDGQLAALARVLEDDRVRDRFVFVATHYAPRLANGGPDRKLHGMRNAEDFLAVCARVRRGAVLFGHVHRNYRVVLPELRAELFGAGSATQEGSEGLFVFDVDDRRMTARRGRYTHGAYVLDEPPGGES